MKITNPKTGEIIHEKSSVDSLSDIRRELLERKKVIEAQVDEVDELLAPFIDKALEAGEEKINNFWLIQRGARRFKESSFREKASKTKVKQWEKLREEIKEIEEPFQEAGRPFLKFPRL